MKRKVITHTNLLITLCLTMYIFPVLRESTAHTDNNQQTIPRGLLCLQRAYQDHITSITQNSIIFSDGEEMIYDDGIKNKDFSKLLNAPDLEDQMSLPYPPGRTYTIPISVNNDPGRIRYEPFFKKIYGDSADEVRKHLVTIRWMPETVNKPLLITSINGIDKKLEAISAECDKLPHDIKPFVSNPAGTFYWRNIRGTKRLSMHSFGIAIDISTASADYWLWDKPNSDGRYVYKNRIPLDIVEIFEKHGFIWGGKWYHYDTMHFEYRPELLIQ